MPTSQFYSYKSGGSMLIHMNTYNTKLKSYQLQTKQAETFLMGDSSFLYHAYIQL